MMETGTEMVAVGEVREAHLGGEAEGEGGEEKRGRYEEEEGEEEDEERRQRRKERKERRKERRRRKQEQEAREREDRVVRRARSPLRHFVAGGADWRGEMCECTRQSIFSWLESLICPCIVTARLSEEAHYLPAYVTVLTFVLSLLIVGWIVAEASLSPGLLVLSFLGVMAIAARSRYLVRARDGIMGSPLEDALISVFCLPLALTQLGVHLIAKAPRRRRFSLASPRVVERHHSSEELEGNPGGDEEQGILHGEARRGGGGGGSGGEGLLNAAEDDDSARSLGEDAVLPPRDDAFPSPFTSPK